MSGVFVSSSLRKEKKERKNKGDALLHLFTKDDDEGVDGEQSINIVAVAPAVEKIVGSLF